MEKYKNLRKEDLQRIALLSLFNNNGFQFTDKWFTYTGGQIGNYYVQSINITADGEDYVQAISHIVEIITLEIGPKNFDVISGGESRDWDFSNPVAVTLRKPHAKIYKDGRIIGAKLEGKRVLHVADLNNEGSSPRDIWVPAIRKAGGKITDILFYVDRLEDGVEVMKNLDLHSHCVIPLDQKAWEILLKNNKITPEIHQSLLDRWEDKRLWAHNMLRNHPEQLAEMLAGDASSQAKANKILDKGYPEIKEELLPIIENLK
jgi:orotate phosphoribosyltransferase